MEAGLLEALLDGGTTGGIIIGAVLVWRFFNKRNGSESKAIVTDPPCVDNREAMRDMTKAIEALTSAHDKAAERQDRRLEEMRDILADIRAKP